VLIREPLRLAHDAGGIEGIPPAIASSSSSSSRNGRPPSTARRAAPSTR
jgi:hypothetical protein